MSIPCDTHHLTPFYIIFSILYCVWKFRKGMILWYIRTHIHEDSRVSIVTAMCGEHSNATFTHHYYHNISNNNIKLDDAFLQLPDTLTHTRQRLSTTPCHLPILIYTIYVYTFTQIYVYTKQISPPLSLLFIMLPHEILYNNLNILNILWYRSIKSTWKK